MCRCSWEKTRFPLKSQNLPGSILHVQRDNQKGHKNFFFHWKFWPQNFFRIHQNSENSECFFSTPAMRWATVHAGSWRARPSLSTTQFSLNKCCPLLRKSTLKIQKNPEIVWKEKEIQNEIFWNTLPVWLSLTVVRWVAVYCQFESPDCALHDHPVSSASSLSLSRYLTSNFRLFAKSEKVIWQRLFDAKKKVGSRGFRSL